MTADWEALREQARAAMARCYVPYSKAAASTR